MKHIKSVPSLAFLGLALAANSVLAEQNTFEKRLVGTWSLVSTTNTNNTGAKVEPFGPHPLGAYMFDPSGHIIQIIVPGEEGAAKNVVATYGTYSVGKTLIVHMIAAAKPGLDGKDLRRAIVSLTDDELKIYNLATTQAAGGATAELVWKRAK